MASLLSGILRKSYTHNKINILTVSAHERFQSNLANTNAEFYMFQVPGTLKTWSDIYAKVPDNHHILNYKLGNNQIPLDVSIDLCLSHNKVGSFQILSQIAQQLNVPFISIEHTQPYPTWTPGYLQQMSAMRAHHNIFITRFSQKAWGFDETNSEVIEHGIDTDLFSPDTSVRKERHILSVVNDWINRDQPCGYNLWRELTNGLPVRPVGATPGLSVAAKSIQDLVNYYRSAQIFINTSLISPVPMSLMEAMSCGCCVVSTATCAIPEFITTGVNGVCTNDPKEFRYYLEKLLDDPAYCKELGDNARTSIVEKYGLAKFTDRWNKIFQKAMGL